MVQTANGLHYWHMTLDLLIVDDSQHIRASLVGLLECIEGMGRISTASNLVDAIRSVCKEPPCIVVLDLQLPDGLGLELIQPIKRLVPNVRIAILTNHAGAPNKRHCLASGADWFFDKSTEFDNLLDVLKTQAAHH